MRDSASQWIIPILLAVGAAAALWYYWMQVSEPPPAPPPEPEPVVEEPRELPGPLHPVASIEPPAEEPAELVPLPPLNQSDDYFKLGLGDVFGDAVESLMVESGLIEKIVATVDNLPRSHVAERIRPVGSIEDQFRIESQDASDSYTISAANSERYDTLISTVLSADMGEAMALYQRFYPLFQDAYQDLGYPNGYFNDRLVEVIDHLLATPEPPGPIQLVRPHVLFEYEDAELEALSSGQKMLLRMGNDHASSVKERLRELRTAITALN